MDNAGRMPLSSSCCRATSLIMPLNTSRTRCRPLCKSQRWSDPSVSCQRDGSSASCSSSSSVSPVPLVHPHRPQEASRRTMLVSLTVLLSSSRAQAQEGILTRPAAPGSDASVYITEQFMLQVPPGFQEAPLPQIKTQAFGAPPPSPVQARFASDDGAALLTVIVRQTAELKPTFLQVKDIADWGDISSIARLVLPNGARVLNSTVLTVPQPARDTGTVLGVVELPPSHLYQYEVAKAGQHVAVVAAVKSGTVYVVGASTSEDRWGASGQQLRDAAASFRFVL